MFMLNSEAQQQPQHNIISASSSVYRPATYNISDGFIRQPQINNIFIYEHL